MSEEDYLLGEDAPADGLDEDGGLASEEGSEDETNGVKTVEATEQVYGRYSRWCLFLGLASASYIYSLDGCTTPYYLTFAASTFGELSLISSIQVSQSIIIAVGKPVIAKIADISSRGAAYVIVLLFYVIGYMFIASASSIASIAGGIIAYAIGYTGLQLLTQIIIADITTLKWRGLVSALVSSPFLINAWVGANIADSVLAHGGWRWGYRMFIILVPLALAPLIATLLWAERRARRLGIVDRSVHGRGHSHSRTRSSLSSSGFLLAKRTRLGRAWRVLESLDFVGLLLFGVAVYLVLIPFTLAKENGGHSQAASGWLSLVGCILFALFVVWEQRYAKRPLFPIRLTRNWSVVASCLIGFTDFISFYLTFTYLYSFILVVKPWTLIQANYFLQTQMLGLTVAGIIVGVLMRYLQRYKPLLIFGLLIRLLGVSLMIRSRGAKGSTLELVLTQLLQGAGGGFAAVSSLVGAQASVDHLDLAMVTAMVLLVTEIGGAVGGAFAGAIWANMMPGRLRRYLPSLSPEDIEELYGSISKAAEHPRGHPIREGVIHAYDDTMKIMVITATVLSVVPVLISLTMPNWYLGDTQNAVDDADGSADGTSPERSRRPHSLSRSYNSTR
ncbi:drug h+ antiporter [Gloeophyllum trabeum ATCC 11539]|uniref:Drug h+ antiporter n=1 Tax=Gloeophyllum trabeum (strain ATCC 11539 / FP-39264 / Madison 617) TaxID=670483 RepID=S7PR90_GLOTA|nr:drug h+ antiporter [Gloeophyllum trabeum ATCC 11539]EPQ50366.1 drug h+ antiporter [Gloeophyllum trabeum ATCC 11539]